MVINNQLRAKYYFFCKQNLSSGLLTYYLNNQYSNPGLIRFSINK